MIEIKNLKMFDDQKAVREDKFSRMKLLDEVQSMALFDFPDDDGHFTVKIACQNSSGRSAIFDTYEKAEAFYNALAAMLPDSDKQKLTIDHKDFE